MQMWRALAVTSVVAACFFCVGLFLTHYFRLMAEQQLRSEPTFVFCAAADRKGSSGVTRLDRCRMGAFFLSYSMNSKRLRAII
jgi:hypothetical protein